jgi:hypothetical protein
MALTYPLIQIGTVYATDDNLSTGTRYIAEIEGLYALTDLIQSTRAIDGTIYNQYQTVKDVEITVRFPLIDSTKGDAIRDVVQAAITGSTTYALNITSDLGTFTFTAKPKSVTFEQSILPSKWANLTIVSYCTD